MSEQEKLHCESCGAEVGQDDYYLAEDPYTESILLLCGDCYHEPPEPPQWAHTPREV